MLELTDSEKRGIIENGILLCGPKYDSQQARILMAAIAYQESNFEHRHQIGGPAHGFWQFEERGGVRGVLNHHGTKEAAKRIVLARDTDFEEKCVFDAIEHDDYLAAAFARLLLWSDPRPIPVDRTKAWIYYLSIWRPGKPHKNRWPDCWEKAIDLYYEE